MRVEFGVLGPLQVTVDGREVLIASGRVTVVLAMLLARPNQAVPVERLASAVWEGADSPNRPRAAIQTYVKRLRYLVGDDVVRTVRDGYRVVVDQDSFDVLAFDALTEQARALLADDPRQATALLDRAVRLWRGPAYTGVESGVIQREEVPPLTERGLAARRLWTESHLNLGEHDRVIAELSRLTREYPLYETFAELLMLGLHRAGRRADALAEYRRIDRQLVEELGLDAGEALQRLHTAILTADPAIEVVAGPASAAGTPSARPVRQLPADVTAFTGRAGALGRLDSSVPGEDDPAARIAVIEGMAGVGKTALAVHFAHRVVDRFPDGQLHLNLRGYGPGEPCDAATALEILLAALGTQGQRIPMDIDARAALWRSRTAGKRLLILLDNARDAAQVRPLLPGPGCFVLVTSRAQQLGLAARDGAIRVVLGALDQVESLELLTCVVGADRVLAELGSAQRIVSRCGGLPLALRILAERAGHDVSGSLSALVSELECGSELHALHVDNDEEASLRVLFQRSHDVLEPAAASMFRMLSVFPGTEFGVDTAAVTAGMGRPDATAALRTLTAANLLEQHLPERFRFHDLLRAFAAEQARTVDGHGCREQAVDRMLDWYFGSVLRACRLLRPDRQYQEPVPAASETGASFVDYQAALDWCDEECDNVVSIVAAALRGGPVRALLAARLEWPVLLRHAHAAVRMAPARRACRASLGKTGRSGRRIDHAHLARGAPDGRGRHRRRDRLARAGATAQAGDR